MRETLDQWNFVIAAYTIAVITIMALVGWSWFSMKRAEARREEARRK